MKNLRTWFEIGLIIACIIFYLFWRHDRGQIIQQKVDTAAKTTLQHPQVRQLTVKKDSEGNTHVQFNAGINQVSQASLSNPAVTKGTFVDSAAIAIKTSARQITELTKENIDLKARLQLKPANASDKNHVFSYSDTHLNLNYDTRTNIANLAYHVNVITGKFTPGTWLPFSTKPPVLDLSTDDPRAAIDNVEHMSVIIPQPVFGYSLQAEGTYLTDTKQIIPALKFDVRIGRIHAGYEGFYIGKLRQAATLSYDLIRKN